MAYETRDNSGTLFRAKEKRSDKSPDYDGHALIGGRKFWLKAWIKEGKSGKFMSLAFTEAEERAKQIRDNYERDDRTSYGTPADEDLPF